MEILSHCINCSTAVSTTYCPTCGQKNPPKKISLMNLYTDFQSRVYGFDGMFPQTLRDLTIRPGKVALDYINGNRVKYVGPVGYFFVMLTIFILSLSVFKIDFYALSVASNPFGKTTTTPGQEAATQMVIKIFSENLRIFQFMLVPLTAIWLKVFFRKSGHSMLEMMVPAFYWYGHVEILAIMNVLLFYFTGFTANSISLPVNILYFGFACMSMFGKGAAPFIKGILVYLTSFFTFMLLNGIFVSVYIATSPELREMMKPK